VPNFELQLLVSLQRGQVNYENN